MGKCIHMVQNLKDATKVTIKTLHTHPATQFPSPEVTPFSASCVAFHMHVCVQSVYSPSFLFT